MHSSRLVFLDLELTALPLQPEGVVPEVLECAVVITDDDLTELGRGHWVIHKNEKLLHSLSPWHQNRFSANSLFDDVKHSTINKTQFEAQLLQLIQKHCQPGQGRLAGASVHADREILMLEHPKVYSYLNHVTVDVSGFKAAMYLWNSDACYRVKDAQVHNNNHRAKEDVENALAEMHIVRDMLRTMPAAGCVEGAPRNMGLPPRFLGSSDPASSPPPPRVSQTTKVVQMISPTEPLEVHFANQPEHRLPVILVALLQHDNGKMTMEAVVAHDPDSVNRPWLPWKETLVLASDWAGGDEHSIRLRERSVPLWFGV